MDARSPGKCKTTYIVLALGLGEFSFINRDMYKNRLGRGGGGGLLGSWEGIPSISRKWGHNACISLKQTERENHKWNHVAT